MSKCKHCAALRALSSQIGAGKVKHVGFQQFSERWETNILPNHKPSSQLSERSSLARLRASFGDKNLTDITTESLQAWITVLKDDLAAKSIKNHVSVLRIMWNSARAWGHVTHNPFDGLIFPQRGLIKNPSFTTEQAREIIFRAEEPFQTMLRVIAETGIRIGEACGLFRSDVDIINQLLHVRRSAWEGVLQTPKTVTAVRTFPISANLCGHLRGLPVNNILLFCTENGKPFEGRFLLDKLKVILAEMGISEKRTGFHSFRRMNSTTMDSLQAPMKIRMERLGHADMKTTMGYTSSMSADHRQLADKLGELFDKSTQL